MSVLWRHDIVMLIPYKNTKFRMTSLPNRNSGQTILNPYKTTEAFKIQRFIGSLTLASDCECTSYMYHSNMLVSVRSSYILPCIRYIYTACFSRQLILCTTLICSSWSSKSSTSHSLISWHNLHAPIIQYHVINMIQHTSYPLTYMIYSTGLSVRYTTTRNEANNNIACILMSPAQHLCHTYYDTYYTYYDTSMSYILRYKI